MSWFKRIKEGITTSTKEKKETPEGLWYKCPSCKKITNTAEHEANLYVCPNENCGYHEKIGSADYFKIIFDNNEFIELYDNLTAGDPLNFVDTKKYTDRLVDTVKKTHLKDALRVGHGKVEGEDLVIACMD